VNETPEFHPKPVDRLDESWVSDHPTYRVTLWSLPTHAEGYDHRYPSAFNNEHWRITGARDVHEVVSWAQADGRLYEVFAESEDADSGPGFTKTVLRLAGYNPALGAGFDPTEFLSLPTELQRVRDAIGESERGH